MKLGLLSDTHGFLDDRLPRIFRGVTHILHAGDIGPDVIIAQLEAIAPVTAVLGNNDDSPNFPLTQVRKLGRLRILIHHIVTPRELTTELKARVAAEKPDLVLFGHTHKPFNERINGVWFVNPGYAGKPKFGAERSVALLDCTGAAPDLRFVRLADPA